MTNYSFKVGILKTLKNGLVVLSPSIVAGALAFIGALPPEIQAEHTAALGFVVYFIKNYVQVKRE